VCSSDLEKIPSLKEKYQKETFNECTTEDGVNFTPDKFSHYNRYLHDLNYIPIGSELFWDTFFRLHIGKTEDINVAMCSHDAIINRETPEHYCRVCHKDLSVVKARVNDYLVLRHPKCTKPICLECSQNNPDEFFKAFERGTETAMAAAHELYGTCNTEESDKARRELNEKRRIEHAKKIQTKNTGKNND
jgi:hypothetical protein